MASTLERHNAGTIKKKAFRCLFVLALKLAREYVRQNFGIIGALRAVTAADSISASSCLEAFTVKS